MTTKNKIKLGYEIETGKEVFILPSHLIVTGITQLSGKTTTLEALIKRSGLKACVFKTKVGEKGFNNQGTEIAPFFRDRSDYEFVKSLIEAYSKEKLFLEKGTLMRLCKGSASLIEIKKRVDEELLTGKLRGLKEEIHTRLQHYLENLIPQIQYANLSNTLNLTEGINIMNLERFSEEAQSLIIQSVADEVLKTGKGVIIVIPECWKFLSQKYNNPCKRTVESFIRQGATNENFVFLDSQDMAGVDKAPLKQISTWILGFQSERNEVKHTLDQINLPKNMKPKEDEIMGLQKGHFYLSSYEGFKKVFVQPTWMTDELAIKIAKGEVDVNTIEQPQNLTPISRAINQQDASGLQGYSGKVLEIPELKIMKKDMIELRGDFFNKIQEIQDGQNKMYSKIYQLEMSKPVINEEEIISKVLQKIPVTQVTHQSNQPVINKEELIKDIIARVPSGTKVYEVAPLEKIKKDFLEEAKNKILSDISNLSNDAKKTLKYLESQGKGCSTNDICMKGFMLSNGGGGNASRINSSIKELQSVYVGEKQSNGNSFGRLKNRVKFLLGTHEATEQETESIYQHILMELLR